MIHPDVSEFPGLLVLAVLTVHNADALRLACTMNHDSMRDTFFSTIHSHPRDVRVHISSHNYDPIQRIDTMYTAVELYV